MLLHFLQVLVEFDYVDFMKREWIHVYRAQLHLFLIENTLCMAPRTVAPFSKDGILHPALVSQFVVDLQNLIAGNCTIYNVRYFSFQTFLALVDNVGLWKQKLQKPVEFLGDLRLDFQDYAKLKTVRRWSDVAGQAGVNQSHKTREEIQAWAELQDCQQVQHWFYDLQFFQKYV